LRLFRANPDSAGSPQRTVLSRHPHCGKTVTDLFNIEHALLYSVDGKNYDCDGIQELPGGEVAIDSQRKAAGSAAGASPSACQKGGGEEDSISGSSSCIFHLSWQQNVLPHHCHRQRSMLHQVAAHNAGNKDFQRSPAKWLVLDATQRSCSGPLHVRHASD
jgi:hypothetical protein